MYITMQYYIFAVEPGTSQYNHFVKSSKNTFEKYVNDDEFQQNSSQIDFHVYSLFESFNIQHTGLPICHCGYIHFISETKLSLSNFT